MMAKPKDGIWILTDLRHWIGWLISAFGITAGIVLTLHLLEKHCVHTPVWVVGVVFIVVFVIVVLIDTIKHLISLQ